MDLDMMESVGRLQMVRCVFGAKAYIAVMLILLVSAQFISGPTNVVLTDL